jgi:hypothetical protein
MPNRSRRKGEDLTINAVADEATLLPAHTCIIRAVNLDFFGNKDMAGSAKFSVSIVSMVAIFVCLTLCISPRTQAKKTSGGCHEQNKSKDATSKHCCNGKTVLTQPELCLVTRDAQLGLDPLSFVRSLTVKGLFAQFHPDTGPPISTVLRV